MYQQVRLFMTPTSGRGRMHTSVIPYSTDAQTPARPQNQAPCGTRVILTLCLILACLSGCSEEDPATGSTGRTSTPDTSSDDPDASAERPRAAGGDTSSPPQASTSLSFADRTEGAGIRFEYRNGEEAGHYSILESLGGGVGILDLDADGYDDVCFAGGGGFDDERVVPAASGLFRWTRNWTFRDVSEVSGVAAAGYYSHGIARGDFDDDGFADLLVTGYGGVELFRNLGDGTFERADPAATGLVDPLWSSSAAWADLNGDGWLDLYVAHYVNWSFANHPFCRGPNPGEREVCPPRVFEGQTDKVFLSQGDGRFTDGTESMGLTPEGKGLGVVISDFDNDGDNDVYVGNDTVPNFLYRNDNGQSLADVSLKSGASLSDNAVPDGSMGVSLLDFNQDGLLEFWVVNFERESSALYMNLGNLLFLHSSRRTGVYAVGQLYVGWGTSCQDFDLDGDEDMFVSNGHVIRYPVNAPILQRPLLFENQRGERVTEIGPAMGPWFQQQHMGRGAAAADFDHDGDQDLAITRTNQPVVVLSNEYSGSGNWLELRLISRSAGRDAIGTRVTLETSADTHHRWIKGGGSYASTETDWVHFGLPPEETPASVTIRWNSGASQTVPVTGTNQRMVVIEPLADDGRALRLPE